MVKIRRKPKPKPSECEAGACSVSCGGGGGCGCISWGDTHEECQCFCYHNEVAAVVNEREIPFKRFKPKIKATSQTKFNICVKNLPITALAEILDKYLPNRIFVPANKLDKKVKYTVKNRPLSKLLTDLGLKLR